MAIRFPLAILLATGLSSAAFGFEPCATTAVRVGADAADVLAMNRAEQQFLGPGSSEGPFTFSGALAQGTTVAVLAGPDISAGLCGDVLRVMAHMRPITADMPDGIGVFTDPATLRGLSRGLRIEAFRWQDIGRVRIGLGLGAEADWTRLHLASSFIDLKSKDFALVVPVTLQLQVPLRRGALDVWLRKSWARGIWGTTLGLALEAHF